MTHRALGVRAERVVAHGRAPRGFLIYGGEATPWTAYVNGGAVPRGAEFARVVKELAERAGIDASPITEPRPRDRRGELLEDFFTLCRDELSSPRAGAARDYLERRRIPRADIDRTGLGLVPEATRSESALRAMGHSAFDIAGAGVLADSRWPGRIAGAWRDEYGRIGTMWTRALQESNAGSRYLYLRGGRRAGLPPYGLSEALSQRGTAQAEVVLVEGFFDVHQLRARGIANVAALGGTGARSEMFERLARLGIERVTLCLDRDAAGRAATAKAVEEAARARRSPSVFVVDPERLAPAKDPDALVKERGSDAWAQLIATSSCGIVWRAVDLAANVAPSSRPSKRREALERAGKWLGSLPRRLALEQEDAVRAVAERCGYSPTAVDRAFKARFWPEPPGRRIEEAGRGL